MKKEDCWDGYKQVGMKTKNGKQVPNCVPTNEEVPGTNISSIPNPAQTAMGPRLKMTSVTDRRRRKDQIPVLLKRFRKYMDDNA